jgi:hypothetical protein
MSTITKPLNEPILEQFTDNLERIRPVGPLRNWEQDLHTPLDSTIIQPETLAGCGTFAQLAARPLRGANPSCPRCRQPSGRFLPAATGWLANWTAFGHSYGQRRQATGRRLLG